MTIRVKLPGGTVANFPDGMPASEIEAVLQKQFPPEAAPAKRSPTEILRGSMANAGSFGTTPQPADMPEGAAAKLGLAGTIATLPLIPATGAALVAAPVATGKAILGGLIGSAAGTAGGEWVGHKIPIVGGATASKVLGTVGGLVGGVGGAVAAPKMTAGNLLRFAAEGRGGVLQAIFGSGEAKAVSAAREAAVAEARDLRNALLKARLEKTVAGTKALEQRVSDSMRKVAVAEAKEVRLAKKAGLSVPEFRAAAAETAPAAAPAAVVVKAEAEAITTQLLKWKEAGMSGGQMTASLRQVYGVPMKDATKLVKALQAAPAVEAQAAAAPTARLRPGTVGPDGQVVRESLDEVRARWASEHGTPLPAAARTVSSPAPPSLRPGTVGPDGQVVRESLDEVKARWASEHGAPFPTGERATATDLGGLARGNTVPAAAGSLQPQRIQVGAQKVGRELGLTKEQVRMEAGPVLNEARGTASPLLPKQAYASIAEKIKTLPRGEARDAYVKLANSEKAMWNVEAIRRTLETQGLVLPFAAVAGLVIKAQAKERD